MPEYRENSFDYHVTYESDAKNDYLDQNIAGAVAGVTLGIIPTYWTTTVHSEATVFENGTPVFHRKYKSRIHSFYGVLWAIIPLPIKDINTFKADEGSGIRIEEGIRNRTFWKIIAEHGGNTNQYCKKEHPFAIQEKELQIKHTIMKNKLTNKLEY